jgi:predicted transcriptional regulator
MKRLTNREEEIMTIFWEKGPSFVKDIIALLPDPKPHYNTISTIVRGLEESGYLGYEQFGNTYRYFAIITRNDYSKYTLKNIVNKYFKKSYSSVVSLFAEENDISEEDLKNILKEIEAKRTAK